MVDGITGVTIIMGTVLPATDIMVITGDVSTRTIVREIIILIHKGETDLTEGAIPESTGLIEVEILPPGLTGVTTDLQEVTGMIGTAADLPEVTEGGIQQEEINNAG
jgi:hypothetical protein